MPPLSLSRFTVAAVGQIMGIPLHSCFAKTRRHIDSDCSCIEKGCDVFSHLYATCRILQIFKEVWKEYPWGETISAEAQWLAALHDIGKVSPAFQTKIYSALGLALPWGKVIIEPEGGHSRLSEIALRTILGKTLAHLAARHHGSAPWRLGPGDTLQNDALGGHEWQKMRENLIDQLETRLQLPSLNRLQQSSTRQEAVLGAVVLADWLSSGMDLPYDTDLPDDDVLRHTIKGAGLFPVLWNPNLTFRELFSFSPNLLQSRCDGLAEPGGIYIIEASMGTGKTEAALFLAYQLLKQKKANGVYFAMPTKLTSEKIFSRLNDFLQRGTAEPSSALLIHGDSYLEWDLKETDDEGFQTMGNCGECGSWFQTKKRALLSPFAAGTVDQALLSVINARHNALRAFALAGKVVIIDEVHSYDNYTGALVANLCRKIREWGGTVVVLSATLTSEARSRLLGTSCRNADAAYPLISVSTPLHPKIREITFPVEKSCSVSLRWSSQESESFSEALERAEHGEQVLWIENTIRDAQKCFCRFQQAVPGIELGLIHSRFPVGIRRENEGRWVDLLGKNGAEERKKSGRILVATQVLEQSVDVDADFLVTRLAPGDMLFQRIGRLWRHPGLDVIRPSGARRQAVVLIPKEFDSPDSLLGHEDVALPYDPYWLFRTSEVWKTLSTVTLPSEIRPVLETIYAERDEEGALRKLKSGMLNRRSILEQMALLAQSEGQPPQNDDRASTRINDTEDVQVLLLKKGNLGLDLKEKAALYGTDTCLLLPAPNAPKAEKLAAVRELLKVMVKVVSYQAPAYKDFPTAPFLSHLLWTGDQEIRPLRAAFVDENGELLTLAGLPVQNKRRLFYHQKLGYCAWEKEE